MTSLRKKLVARAIGRKKKTAKNTSGQHTLHAVVSHTNKNGQAPAGHYHSLTHSMNYKKAHA